MMLATTVMTFLPKNQRGSGLDFVVRADDSLWQQQQSEHQPSRRNIRRSSDDDVLILTNAHCVLTPQELAPDNNQHTTKTVYYCN